MTESIMLKYFMLFFLCTIAQGGIAGSDGQNSISSKFLLKDVIFGI